MTGGFSQGYDIQEPSIKDHLDDKMGHKIELVGVKDELAKYLVKGGAKNIKKAPKRTLE